MAEYNPFHNGHAHQIERTRAADNGCGATHVVAVMSGHFVQRGEPALLPKADRVKAALRGGVDLVLELPVPWCLSSAEGFAFGAVSLLDALGCVDVLSFGSECGDLQALEQAVDVLASPRFADLLAYHLEGGLPFPEARQKAAAELRGGVAPLFESPNNTLGIEYIKALRRLTSGMAPFTVRRFGAGHDDRLPAGDMASATFLRSLIEADRLLNATAYMPAPCAAVLAEAAQEGRCPAAVSRLERALLARLRTMSPAEFASLPALSEGLENRLASAARAGRILPGAAGRRQNPPISPDPDPAAGLVRLSRPVRLSRLGRGGRPVEKAALSAGARRQRPGAGNSPGGEKPRPAPAGPPHPYRPAGRGCPRRAGRRMPRRRPVRPGPASAAPMRRRIHRRPHSALAERKCPISHSLRACGPSFFCAPLSESQRIFHPNKICQFHRQKISTGNPGDSVYTIVGNHHRFRSSRPFDFDRSNHWKG